uniref:Tyrosine-protein kinase Fps85D (inferred by orthology to a D. melanogaster protein) n=1 Tax=Strongyloides venezuelensis TaxID=75913 RepID=A0A0K0F3E7_STRVS
MDKTKKVVKKTDSGERTREGSQYCTDVIFKKSKTKDFDGRTIKKSTPADSNPKTVKKSRLSNLDVKPILKKSMEIEAKTLKKAKSVEIDAKTIKKKKSVEIEAKTIKKKGSIEKSLRSVYVTSAATQIPNVSSAPNISGAIKVSSMSNVSSPHEMQTFSIPSVMLKATVPMKEESKKFDSYELKNDGNGIVHVNGYVLLTNKKFKKSDTGNAKDKTTTTVDVTKKVANNTVSKRVVAPVPEKTQNSIDTTPTKKGQKTVEMSREFNGPMQPVKKLAKLGWLFNKPPANIDILNLSDSVFDNLYKDEWFHGIMRKDDVRDLLSKNGHFMVYCDYTEMVKPKIILSCNWSDKRIHFIFKIKKNEVSLFNLKSETISELINRLFEQQTPIHKTHKAILQIPVPKQSWEMKKDDINLNKRIGQGAFGDVWYGTTKLGGGEEDTYVAIKVPKTKLLEKHINIYPEVLSEVAFMRLFNHENIVKFYGACFSSQPIYMVLEFSEYGCLKKYIKKYKIVNNSDLIKMAIDASLGIGYIHSKYGIHCDIATRNCLVFPDNVVKISDFGQAVILKSNEKEHRIDKSETLLPLRWLSAETLQDSIYSYKTDVYSFGIFLWELFNNCNEPFEKMKTNDLIQGILNGIKPESPPTVMKEVVSLIEEQCLNLDPEKRPHMKEVTKILKSIQSKLTQQA